MTTITSDAVQLGRYSEVDAAREAAELVAFIEHAEKMSPIPQLRELSYALLEVQAGQRVVDIGCGAGISVAELTAHGLDVTGIDPSAQMINVARTRFPDCDYLVRGAEDLPFPTSSVDGYRAERVYQHLKDPKPAIDEAKRVLKPGSRAVIVDIDADTWVVDSDDKAVTRRLLEAFADTLTNPWMGRKLRGFLLDNGFTDVTVKSAACLYTNYDDCVGVLESIASAGLRAGVVTQAQSDQWLAEQRDRSARNRFFVHGSLLVAAGVLA